MEGSGFFLFVWFFFSFFCASHDLQWLSDKERFCSLGLENPGKITWVFKSAACDLRLAFSFESPLYKITLEEGWANLLTGVVKFNRGGPDQEQMDGVFW